MLKKLVRTTVAAVAVLAAASAAQAEMPAGPIKLIVGFGEGGGGDTLAREVARRIEASTGVNIIVENIGGGAGSVAATELAKRDADGTSIAMTLSMAHTFVPLTKSLDYNPSEFTYLATVSDTGTVFAARADHGYSDFAGLIEKAKSDGYLTYGTLTPVDRLLMSAIGKRSGFEIDIIPAKGGSELRAALVAGDAEAILTGASGLGQITENPTLQPLATFNSNRLAAAPDLPTLKELGFDLAMDESFVFFAPAGLPADIAKTLEEEILKTAQDPELKQLIERSGSVPVEVDGATTKSNLAAQTELYRALIAETE